MKRSDRALSPLLLSLEYRDYVWGGRRLRPDFQGPTAEAWIVYEDNLIANPPLSGMTVKEAAIRYGQDLLGRRAVQSTGERFPLLIKLIDTAAWLSLQVHPNDEQAGRLEGAGFFGKTEAWYFIEADEGAEILCGLKRGTSVTGMEKAIRQGTILDLVQRHHIRSGDSVLISPGVIHTMGPGLLVYEVQQTSDITYRVFDWNRPVSAGRPLHIDKSIAVSDPSLVVNIAHAEEDRAGQKQTLVSCDYFSLNLIHLTQKGISLDTFGETFHALTCISGRASLSGDGWNHELDKFATVLIPAAIGSYNIQAADKASILISSV